MLADLDDVKGSPCHVITDHLQLAREERHRSIKTMLKARDDRTYIDQFSNGCGFDIREGGPQLLLDFCHAFRDVLAFALNTEQIRLRLSTVQTGSALTSLISHLIFVTANAFDHGGQALIE